MGEVLYNRLFTMSLAMQKVLFDFLPLLLFFIALKVGDIYWATGMAMLASVAQIVYLWWRKRPIELMNWVNLFLILGFGSATLYLQDQRFIQWKPSILYWLFALFLLGAQWLFHKNGIQLLMGKHIQLSPIVWKRLLYAWVIFFIVMGVLNAIVAFSGYFTLEQWGAFKVFGSTALLILFVVAQSIYLSRHSQSAS